MLIRRSLKNLGVDDLCCKVGSKAHVWNAIDYIIYIVNLQYVKLA